MARPRLQSLAPRVKPQGTRVTVLQSVSGYTPTPRDRGRPWRRKRAAWLYAHPLCRACEERGQVTQATEVDHVIPLWKGGPDDETNYQSLCSDDSKAKTALEAAERASLGLMAKD